MNCRQAREIMFSYLDGELNQEKIARLQDHLDQCSDCSELFETRKRLIKFLDKLPVPSLRSDFEKETVARVRQRIHRWHRSFRRAAAAVIIFGLAVGAAVGLVMSPEQPSPGQSLYENSITSTFSVSPTGSMAETQLLEGYHSDELVVENGVAEQNQVPADDQPAAQQNNQ